MISDTQASTTQADSFCVSSILDRIRPARPALSTAPRRRPEDLRIHYVKLGRLVRYFLHHPVVCSTGAEDDDEGVPGDDE